jgi:glucosamine kinase
MRVTLIADSGATKCEWCLLVNGKKKKTIITDGLSPYFLTAAQIKALLEQHLLPKIKNFPPKNIFFYGTGLANPANAKANIEINNDLDAAARALCGKQKGIACILGTGANAGYFNGKKIAKNSPGLGYVLGDEGSGAYLGKKVVQYYLYQTFDEELMARFNKRFNTSKDEILNNVYKQPLANRYLASFAIFLSENRGHYMIENIIEDGLNDFFFTHLYKFKESWKLPINFVGSVAFGFKDVLKDLCNTYELELGKVLKAPMEGLITYHK